MKFITKLLRQIYLIIFGASVRLSNDINGIVKNINERLDHKRYSGALLLLQIKQAKQRDT